MWHIQFRIKSSIDGHRDRSEKIDWRQLRERRSDHLSNELFNFKPFFPQKQNSPFHLFNCAHVIYRWMACGLLSEWWKRSLYSSGAVYWQHSIEINLKSVSVSWTMTKKWMLADYALAKRKFIFHSIQKSRVATARLKYSPIFSTVKISNINILITFLTSFLGLIATNEFCVGNSQNEIPGFCHFGQFCGQ